jgi:hypothetical protein
LLRSQAGQPCLQRALLELALPSTVFTFQPGKLFFCLFRLSRRLVPRRLRLLPQLRQLADPQSTFRVDALRFRQFAQLIRDCRNSRVALCQPRQDLLTLLLLLEVFVQAFDGLLCPVDRLFLGELPIQQLLDFRFNPGGLLKFL